MLGLERRWGLVYWDEESVEERDGGFFETAEFRSSCDEGKAAFDW